MTPAKDIPESEINERVAKLLGEIYKDGCIYYTCEEYSDWLHCDWLTNNDQFNAIYFGEHHSAILDKLDEWLAWICADNIKCSFYDNGLYLENPKLWILRAFVAVMEEKNNVP